MSDKVKDDFKQIDLSALENFGEEKIKRGKESEPDWDKFKAFYEDLKSEQKEGDSFKALFDTGTGIEIKEKPVFKQFGEKKNKENNIEPDKTVYDEDREPVSESMPGQTTEETDAVSEDVNKTEDDDQETSDLTTADLKAHDQPGYDKGYDQGLGDGKKDGYKKGFEQGEKDGQEKGSEQGYAEGYEKGEIEAEKDIKKKIDEKTEDFKEILYKLENTYQELAHRYEEKIISLICSIAEKVVLAKVEIDEEIVKETVLDALNTLPEPEDITLSVSDEDYEYIEMVKEDLFDSIKSLKSVSVKSDASVKRGGCRIETKQGYVETDIETKLKKIFLSIKGNQSI
ncbi:MAG: hypothetical protein KAR45_22380 [Desulfobacteraceae bacterium]|nr:hypothetical protein [Desulfobacteraceae bacterium]